MNGTELTEHVPRDFMEQAWQAKSNFLCEKADQIHILDEKKWTQCCDIFLIVYLNGSISKKNVRNKADITF